MQWNQNFNFPSGPPNGYVVDVTALAGSPVAGDFVRVQLNNDGENHPLSLAEVRVFADQPYGPYEPSLANVAVGKVASQSTTRAGPGGCNLASCAVDGNNNGAWAGNSVTHTLNETTPWWQVDLGGLEAVSHIRLWDRTDCCGERLDNFRVSLWQGDPTAGGIEVAGMDVASTDDNAIGVNFRGLIGHAVPADFVRVQLLDDGDLEPLSLAEVEVFAWQMPDGLAVVNPIGVDLASIVVTDTCAGGVTTEHWCDTYYTNDPCNASMERKFKVVDACSNVTVASITYTFNDHQPVITSFTDSAYLGCHPDGWIPEVDRSQFGIADGTFDARFDFETPDATVNSSLLKEPDPIALGTIGSAASGPDGNYGDFGPSDTGDGLDFTLWPGVSLADFTASFQFNNFGVGGAWDDYLSIGLSNGDQFVLEYTASQTLALFGLGGIVPTINSSTVNVQADQWHQVELTGKAMGTDALLTLRLDGMVQGTSIVPGGANLTLTQARVGGRIGATNRGIDAGIDAVRISNTPDVSTFTYIDNVYTNDQSCEVTLERTYRYESCCGAFDEATTILTWTRLPNLMVGPLASLDLGCIGSTNQIPPVDLTMLMATSDCAIVSIQKTDWSIPVLDLDLNAAPTGLNGGNSAVAASLNTDPHPDGTHQGVVALDLISSGNPWGEVRPNNPSNVPLPQEVQAGDTFTFSVDYFVPASIDPSHRLILLSRWNGVNAGSPATSVFLNSVPAGTWQTLTLSGTIPATDGNGNPITFIHPFISFHDPNNVGGTGPELYVDNFEYLFFPTVNPQALNESEWELNRTFEIVTLCGVTERVNQAITYILNTTVPEITSVPKGQDWGCQPPDFCPPVDTSMISAMIAGETWDPMQGAPATMGWFADDYPGSGNWSRRDGTGTATINPGLGVTNAPICDPGAQLLIANTQAVCLAGNGAGYSASDLAQNTGANANRLDSRLDGTVEICFSPDIFPGWYPRVVVGSGRLHPGFGPVAGWKQPGTADGTRQRADRHSGRPHRLRYGGRRLCLRHGAVRYG